MSIRLVAVDVDLEGGVMLRIGLHHLRRHVGLPRFFLRLTLTP